MAAQPHESVCIAVIDGIVSIGMADDGSVDRRELETTALRREEFAKAALARYTHDHPAPDGDGETYNAIGDGLLLLAADTVTWMLGNGNLIEPTPGRVSPGKPLKVNGAPYSPGAAREEDLFHSIRRVTPKRLELIRKSMEELGDLSEFFPVLRDVEGNVVDGRHRLAIDENWPAMRVRVPMDMRVAAAVAANRNNSWSSEDWQRLLHHRQQSLGRRRAVRTIARLALLEDASRSDREIGRITGASANTVADVRRELLETAQIEQFPVAEGGRPRSDGSPAQPRTKLTDQQKQYIIENAQALGGTMTEREIGQRLGLLTTGHSSSAITKVIDREKGRRAAAEARPEPEPQPVNETVPEPCNHSSGFVCMDCGEVRR